MVYLKPQQMSLCLRNRITAKKCLFWIQSEPLLMSLSGRSQTTYILWSNPIPHQMDGFHSDFCSERSHRLQHLWYNLVKLSVTNSVLYFCENGWRCYPYMLALWSSKMNVVHILHTHLQNCCVAKILFSSLQKSWVSKLRWNTATEVSLSQVVL